MEPTNHGQQVLMKLAEPHGAGKKCARIADVKQNQISQWCRGTLPYGINRTKLERLGIDHTWWDLPPLLEVDADLIDRLRLLLDADTTAGAA